MEVNPMENERPDKLAYNLQEAAEVMALSKRTIRRLVHRGLLRPSKAVQRFIFSRKELERFLAETSETVIST